jgi:hypothetical protein
MEERREQFECSYCGQKFNFRKDALEHEQNCPQRGEHPNVNIQTPANKEV